MATPAAEKKFRFKPDENLQYVQYVPYLYNIDRSHPDRTSWNWLNWWPRKTLKRKLYQTGQERKRAYNSTDNSFPGTNGRAVNRYRKHILDLKKKYPNSVKDLSEEEITEFKRERGLLAMNKRHAANLEARLNELRRDLAVPDAEVRAAEVPETGCVGAGCLPLEWKGGFTKKKRATRRKKQRSKRH